MTTKKTAPTVTEAEAAASSAASAYAAARAEGLPSLAEAEAAAEAAAVVLREARARAEAEAAEAAARAAAARVERSKRVVASFDVVDRAVAARIDEAIHVRDSAVDSLDLVAILPAEAAYHAAVNAANLFRNAYNSAVHILTSAGVYEWNSRPVDKPERRERAVSLFTSSIDDGLLDRAIRRRAAAMADDVLAEVLDDLGMADLVEDLD